MNETSFDKLEQRVDQAIALITRLKDENRSLREAEGRLTEELSVSRSGQERMADQHRRLQEDHRALQRDHGALQGAHAALQVELEEVRRRSIDREEYETRKRALENRVETLLSRFAELDQAGLF
jgi:FtsZ-binding cell division protein ZapB